MLKAENKIKLQSKNTCCVRGQSMEMGIYGEYNFDKHG
jgi:hypothetical protein